VLLIQLGSDILVNDPRGTHTLHVVINIHQNEQPVSCSQLAFL
jgi:hypothetical protein